MKRRLLALAVIAMCIPVVSPAQSVESGAQPVQSRAQPGDAGAPPVGHAAQPEHSAAQAAGSSAVKGDALLVRHVFLIVLENQSFAITFGTDTRAPYLAKTLREQGALLPNYYGIGHSSLDNYIALISGQAPNADTQGDCPIVTEFRMTSPQLDPDGQALGMGCIYPTVVKTLPDQLEAARLTWKGYMEDMGNDPARESATCGHSPIGSREKAYVATAKDKYAARHNPFVYFHRILDDTNRCRSHVVNLHELRTDLQSLATTPNFVFVTPNLCNDGHDVQCAGGQPGGFAAIEGFLKQWVPRIMNSAAYKQDGLLIITFDESDSIGPEASTACCGEKRLPGSDQEAGFSGPGGGRVGAVLLSPFIRPGTSTNTPYNHYSTLRSIEDQFGLEHLGYAGQAGLQSFGQDVFTQARSSASRSSPTP